MRLVAVLAVAALAPFAVGSRPVATQTDEAFVPLFNGKDLAGWRNINCAPDTFTARDGEIYSTGKPICEIRTERMYENFVLELEYQHLKAGGNAGVFIWAGALPARGEPFLRAIEVQVLDGHETANYTSHGDVFAIHGAVLTPDRPHPAGWMRSLPSERRAKPAGEWNHYRITANGGVIKLAVNGKEVSGGHDISPRKGYIALESEGAPTRFRNLRLRELPSSGALPASQIAQADTGFLSLYNGDLSGWREHPRGDQWRADDWTLVSDGTAAGDLVSEQSYADFVLIVDWRVPVEKEGATATSAGPSSASPASRTSGAEDPRTAARLTVTPPVTAETKAGQWHRQIVTMRGDLVSMDLDGRPVVQNLKSLNDPLRGPIVLHHGGRRVEFANIFVKPLP